MTEEDKEKLASYRLLMAEISAEIRSRRDPELISGSRKRRIALGSGTQVQDVGRLIKQHKQMQKMMKKFTSKGGMMKMMRGLGGMMPGGLPKL